MKNPRLIDLSQQRFGLWRVLHQNGNSPRGGALWACLCDCGVERTVMGADLRTGRSTGCRCATRNRLGDASRTHGQTGTRLYNIWKSMRTRCSDVGNPLYGGRGISVCSEWADFPAFREWALSNGYSKSLSIERIDNDAGYSPANCTWATAKTQSNNRRFIRRIRGRPAHLVAENNGIPARVFRWRVGHGWATDEAATWPMGKKRPRVHRNASANLM